MSEIDFFLLLFVTVAHFHDEVWSSNFLTSSFSEAIRL